MSESHVETQQRMSWKSTIARNSVQAIIWAFGVATVVSGALVAIVLIIAFFNDSPSSRSTGTTSPTHTSSQS